MLGFIQWVARILELGFTRSLARISHMNYTIALARTLCVGYTAGVARITILGYMALMAVHLLRVELELCIGQPAHLRVDGLLHLLTDGLHVAAKGVHCRKVRPGMRRHGID